MSLVWKQLHQPFGPTSDNPFLYFLSLSHLFHWWRIESNWIKNKNMEIASKNKINMQNYTII